MLLLTIVMAALLSAGSATAGTLSYVPDMSHGPDCQGKCGPGSYVPERMSYDAAPGETNDLTVSADADGAWVVHDTVGVAIGTGDTRCTLVDPQTARCGRRLTHIALGDGDDHALDESGSALDGGDGDDVLVSTGVGPGAHTISGGAGDDVLRGGDAAETFSDGPGTDRIDAGGGDDVVKTLDGLPTQNPGPVEPRHDTFDGGPGKDTIDATGSSIPVHIDLAGGPDGDDTLIGFEAALGSNADDVIHGSSGPDTIASWGGNDRIDGGDGDDDIELHGGGIVLGGAGDDRVRLSIPHDLSPYSDPVPTALVDTGPGDDRITGVTLNAVVRCGLGDDTAVTVTDDDDDLPGLVGDDCEHGTGHVALYRRGAGRLHVERGCPGRDVGVTRCSVRVRVRNAAGRTIGAASFRRAGDLDDFSSPVGRVVLPRAVRASIRSGHRPVVRVTVERRAVALGRTSVERGTLRVRLLPKDVRPLR